MNSTIKKTIILFGLFALATTAGATAPKTDSPCCGAASSVGAIPDKIAAVNYNEDFLKQSIAGDATIRLDIDATGKVTKAELLTFVDEAGNMYEAGSNAEPWLRSLDESLVEAALKSSFSPAIICDEPVQVQQLYTFEIAP